MSKQGAAAASAAAKKGLKATATDEAGNRGTTTANVTIKTAR